MTYLLEDGCDIRIVLELLGQEDVKTTMILRPLYGLIFKVWKWKPELDLGTPEKLSIVPVTIQATPRQQINFRLKVMSKVLWKTNQEDKER